MQTLVSRVVADTWRGLSSSMTSFTPRSDARCAKQRAILMATQQHSLLYKHSTAFQRLPFESGQPHPLH